MFVEQIVLQQVIHYGIRKIQSCGRPVDQPLSWGSANTNFADAFCFSESAKDELFLLLR